MSTFYDEWLETPSKMNKAFRDTPGVARDRDIPWVATHQDARVKLMISRDLGYATMGSNILKAEIPVGWHTGKHRHGEEAIYFLSGEGCSIVAGQRFDWRAGSCLHIPFWYEHQHFNLGKNPAGYLSGMTFDLERFVHLARIEQLAECGENGPDDLARLGVQESEYYNDGRRAIMHIDDAPTDLSTDDLQGALAAAKNQHDFTQYLMFPRNGFQAISVAVTHRWIEPPMHHSGRHKHLEAVVYTIEGSGYTDIGGERVPWDAGDVLYVPPAMWEHQHSNENDSPVVQLRIAFGIRPWFTEIWPEGFTSQRIYDADGNPIEAGPIVRERER